MSRKGHLLKRITTISIRWIRRFLKNTERQIIWLLRAVFRSKRQQNTANAGFILPTVAMVSIVVVLLTTAIMLRSFERAKNASNVRVNQAVLNAATPAIDRGRAKINQLFADTSLPKAIPTDKALYTVFKSKIESYTFGDETPLKIWVDLDRDNTVDEPTSTTKIYDDETSVTAWRFPVDTDNNGKFDSYTLYGIYFRTPQVGTNNRYARARNALEARTPPMADGTLDANCASNTSAQLVGSTGWVKQNGELKKSFFVYTTTVPITTTPTDTTNYEVYNGNKGFAAVEYQQDRIQIPPNNNAVVYEDDLQINPGKDDLINDANATFNLNGAIFTNSNLLTGTIDGNIRIFQISSQKSCFYKASNAFIVVGGNISNGSFTGTLSKASKIDLFNGTPPASPSTSSWTRVDWGTSVTENSTLTAYNNLAYANRINALVNAQIAADSTGANDPTEVKIGIAQKSTDLGITLTSGTADFTKYRRQQLERYFRKRTRKVPFDEVAFGATDTPPTPLLQGSGDTLRANNTWIYPLDPNDGITGTSYTKLTLNTSGTTLNPQASDPETIKSNSGTQSDLGDRVLISHNLPELWWDPNKTTTNKFVGSGITDTQNISGVTWKGSTKTRTRRSYVQTLQEVGDTGRDGPWELDAAKVPTEITDPVGGLRVVTGAGVYLSASDTPTSITSTVKEIWPDTMPVPGTAPTTRTITPYWMYAYMGSNGQNIAGIKYRWPDVTDTTNDAVANTPYLKMRAAAVYHYKSTNYNAQTPTPIACVSSHYVPTNSTTAKNVSTGGSSNNGIVYGPPTRTSTYYATALTYLSKLTYPVAASGKTKVVDTTHNSYRTGRLIDDGLLARALEKTNPSTRTISEQSAIDAQICALQILDGSISPSNSMIPDGAIYETTFLDSREVERNSGTDLTTTQTTTYDRPVIDRQPLEIRATVLDLDQLRQKPIGTSSPTQEYLLPNSGIIYATRDDALSDGSADFTGSGFVNADTSPYNLGQLTDAGKLVSPVDYKIDPYRRPSAIMLIKGSNLSRVTTYRDEEKGLILATNLPVYIKGNFNLHSQEEFTDAIETTAGTWDRFYERATLNPNFACRTSDPRLPNCTTGDTWRPATVLADAVTLLSGNFREGFREEGDYDWSHNNLASVPTGFSKYNNFVTQYNWPDTSTITNVRDFDSGTTGYQGSSYLNNFVTPIVYRTTPGSYLTEVCPVSNVVNGNITITTGSGKNATTTTVSVDSYCSDPTKWTIQTACSDNGGGNTYLNDKIVNKNGGLKLTYDANGNPVVTQNNRLKTGYIFDDPTTSTCFDSAAPRRIALLRDVNTGIPISPMQVLGVDKSGSVAIFNFPSPGNNIMPTPNSTSIPWLKPVFDNSGNITSLSNPILQIQQPFHTPGSNDNTTAINTKGTSGEDTRRWLQPALATTTFNLIAATGDSPARPTEDNGGLQNFVRLLENWQTTTADTGSPFSIKISGAFMQLRKSAYATGTFTATSSTNQYAISNNSGRTAAYLPGPRSWGYDVGLLSQSPDQFASKLVLTPPDLPDEYFREVGRDDSWVKTLLCASNANDTTKFAIDADQRPSCTP
ncbi:hormogonium polysaccharide biosynthesis protein HpsA [Cuspidothrix issatschenkoi]|uniref:Uncharacterized protein n=1 Tax=Cuspidothrix issatschenkoi CHARLIE-1 TaxID=2052836 RepID=A0A2S6CYT1_9CYAN|nr:hormogonium polysaccharide biosynthesis protein HpsA [Cuspidothrix issatschenkoi]PPJ64925.1 hypothetical protein CUN59_02165 [Cuspidothrix issatschenkoi CHARLIE-1]